MALIPSQLKRKKSLGYIYYFMFFLKKSYGYLAFSSGLNYMAYVLKVYLGSGNRIKAIFVVFFYFSNLHTTFFRSKLIFVLQSLTK